MGAGNPPRDPARVLRAGVPHAPDVPSQAADSRARGGPPAAGDLHRKGRRARPGGLSQQRADGVRLGLRPRCLPRTGLHSRLPAPVGGLRQSPVRRRAVGLSVAPDRRGLQVESLRRENQDPSADRRPGRGSPSARRSLLPVLLGTDHEKRPAAGRDHRPRATSRTSPPSSAGPRGRVPPSGPGTTTPIRTTGLRSRACRTSPRRT